MPQKTEVKSTTSLTHYVAMAEIEDNFVSSPKTVGLDHQQANTVSRSFPQS